MSTVFATALRSRRPQNSPPPAFTIGLSPGHQTSAFYENVTVHRADSGGKARVSYRFRYPARSKASDTVLKIMIERTISRGAARRWYNRITVLGSCRQMSAVPLRIV